MQLPFLLIQDRNMPIALFPKCAGTTAPGPAIARAAVLLAMSALVGCASLSGKDRALPATPSVQGDGVTVYAAGDIADCRKTRAADSGWIRYDIPTGCWQATSLGRNLVAAAQLRRAVAVTDDRTASPLHNGPPDRTPDLGSQNPAPPSAHTGLHGRRPQDQSPPPVHGVA